MAERKNHRNGTSTTSSGRRMRGMRETRQAVEALEQRTLLMGAPTYDLSGYDCYAPASATWGQTIEVQSQIRNAGIAQVNLPFFVAYYLSNDTVFGDADDILLYTYDHQADVPGSGGVGPNYIVNLTLPAALPAGYPATGTVYIGMKTDSTNAIAEISEANNFGVIGQTWDWDALTVSPLYDLSGYDCYAPASANWGQIISVQSQIRNTGTTTVTEPFFVSYYLSNDAVFGDADDILLYTNIQGADVPGGGYGPDYNVNITLPSIIPAGYAATGVAYIGMKTDSANEIAESNETNNFGAMGQGYDWDLLILSPSYDLWGWNCYAPASANWGQTISVQSRIRNDGPTYVTTPFYVAYYLSNDTVFGDADDVFLNIYGHVAGVPGAGVNEAGYGPEYSVNLVLPGTPPSGYAASGTMYIGMQTDLTNAIAESNETNNFGAIEMGYDWDSLNLNCSYDLSGWDCYAPASATWGQTISVQSQIRNTGTPTVTEPFYVAYYLSNDLTFGDADDFFVGQYEHQADVPASGYGPDYTVNLTLPTYLPVGYSVTGTVYIGMKTDSQGTGWIPESNETNNFGAIGMGYDWDALTISSGWELSGYDCYAPDSANWGQTISVQSQIRNTGTAPVTAPFFVAYYLSNDTVFGDADDILLYIYDHQADVPAGGVGPDYTVNLTLPTALPAGYSPTGTVYIGMKTDSTNLMAESNEANNFGVIGQTWDWDSLVISPL